MFPAGCIATSFTAVCVDLANCEPKRCAHEYNCMLRLPIQPVKKFTNNIHVHSFLVHILQHQCKQLYLETELNWSNSQQVI